MGLSNILTLVEADIVANLSGPLAAVTFRRGVKELRQMDKPPRIVWVRQPGEFVASKQTGTRNVYTTARPLRTHVTRVMAHVWADVADDGDDTDTETLASTMIAGLYRVAHGTFEVLGDDWPQPDWLTQGALSVVLLEFRIPVTDAAPPTSVAVSGLAMPFDESTQPPPEGELQAPGDD